MRQLLCFVFLILFTLGGSAAYADSTKRVAERIYQEVLSPFCPGRALQDCPSTSAGELKHKILEDLESGKSEEQVLTELYQEYGDSIRAVPQFAGFGMLAWIAPIVFIVVVGFIIKLILLRPKQVLASTETVTELSDADRERLNKTIEGDS
ncbi:MAG: cytochrome c-type biogenesis protein CcmH [Bdellovibrionales bacterium]|nr:cytochrome c-type biogenesis protein CcmH [Bdellovibrionales bacterium]